MRNHLIFFFCSLPLSWSCQNPPTTYHPDKKPQKQVNHDSFFSGGDSWGGWVPPAGNNDWKQFLEMWGNKRTTSPPDLEDRNLNWPQHWMGYGWGMEGIPPPPWAFVPGSYDRPQYCFQRPQFGDCSENVTRWGFNPTKEQCQTFAYSGCGGNENNFMTKERCTAACVDSGATECLSDPVGNLEEMIDFNFH